MREWLVPALGIAASPLPVAVMLLMLGGSRALRRGTSFWLAWTIGIGAATAGFLVLAESVEEHAGVARAIAWGEIVVGIALVAIGLRIALRGRQPRSAESPRWLLALDRVGAAEAAWLGIALSAFNPKNLALVLSGTSAIAEAEELPGELALAGLGFVAVSVATVSVLLAGRAFAARRTLDLFAVLRAFAVRHQHVLTLVLGVLVGLYFVLDGFRRL